LNKNKDDNRNLFFTSRNDCDLMIGITGGTSDDSSNAANQINQSAPAGK